MSGESGVVRVGPGVNGGVSQGSKGGSKGRSSKGRSKGRGGGSSRALQQSLDAAVEESRKLREALRSEKDAVAKYRGQARALAAENATLRKALAHDERDPALMISFLNQELASRDAGLAALQERMDVMQQAYTHEMAKVKHAFEAELLDAESRIDEVKYAYEVLEAEVLELREFKGSKQFIIDELDLLRSQLYSSRIANLDSIDKQEEDLRAAVDHVTEMYQQRIDNLEAGAKTAVLEVLDRETRQIVRDNRRMANELRMLYAALDDSRAAHDATKANLADLTQEYDVLLRFLRARGLPLPPRDRARGEGAGTGTGAGAGASVGADAGAGADAGSEPEIVPQVQDVIDRVNARAVAALTDLGLDPTPAAALGRPMHRP